MKLATSTAAMLTQRIGRNGLERKLCNGNRFSFEPCSSPSATRKA